MNIVQLPVVDLSDIPSRLRNMADRIESGEIVAETMFVVIPVPGTYPRLFGWGDIDGKNDPSIQLDLVKFWLLTNLVERV